MKRLVAFTVLLMHMNYFMFLPQIEEVDTYDANGLQTDDINSVVEYVQVILGIDKTADDEDDDSGNQFTLVKSFDFFYQQQITILLKHPGFVEISNKVYIPYKTPTTLSPTDDIISPPPEA
jgi:hypothetical protein